MTKFRTDFECKVDVDFKDYSKAKGYFIDRGGFHDIASVSDMSELAEYLSRAFHFAPETWSSKHKSFTKFLEGFGLFVQQGDKYIITEDYLECGMIEVWYEQEIEEAGTYQL